MRRVGIQPHLLDVHQKELSLVSWLLDIVRRLAGFMLSNYIIFCAVLTSPCSKPLAKLSSLL